MKNINLADDNTNDCVLFQDVLEEFIIQNKLSILKNGVALMAKLEKTILALKTWQTAQNTQRKISFKNSLTCKKINY